MAKLCRILLLLFALVGITASAGHRSTLTIALTPAGIHSKYATIAAWDAAAGSLRWGTPTTISIAAGATGSQNARDLLLDDSGSATIAAICVPALPTAGFSSGANGIQWSSATAYSGTCHYTATRSSLTAISDAFTVTAIAPPSSDTTAPPIPVSLSCISGASGTVPCTWDRAWDAYTTEAGEGTDYYQLRAGATVVATVDADAAIAKQPQLVTTNIGAGSGTHSATRLGNQLTLVCAGTGQDGFADGQCFHGAAISGQVCVDATITSITNTATYNKAGPEIRSSLDANAIAFGWYTLREGGVYKAQARRRASVGGNRGTLVTVTLTGLPVTLRECKEANGDIAHAYSYDRNAFTTAVNSTSTGMPSTAQVGFAATATSAGNAVTAVLTETNIWQGSLLTNTHNTSTGGAYSVRACDAAANCSSYGATVTATPSAPADVTPPSTPGNPVCSESGTTTINCSADAATDANGIRGYVWCVGASAGTCTDAAEQVGISYSITGLTASTQRYAKVKAVDNASNVGGYSTQVNATTASSGSFDAVTVPTMSCVGTSTSNIRCTNSAIDGAHHYIRGFYNPSNGNWGRLTQYDSTALSADFGGWSPGSTGCYRVAASADAADAVIGPWSESGVPSGADCGTTTSTSGAVKYHPGHYVSLGGLTYTSAWMSTFNNELASICANANIKGIQLTKTWAAYEGPTAGDYSTGFSYTDQVLAAAQACNKRVIFKLAERIFGGPRTGNPSAGSDSWAFPSYLMTTSAYGNPSQPYGIAYPPIGSTWGGGLTMIARMWDPAVMDRLIALSQAYGARYNSHAYFEMFSLEETSFSLPAGSFDFSASAYHTQNRRWISATSVAMPNTTVRIMANYGSNLPELYELCVSLRNCGVGGPDPELPVPLPGSGGRMVEGNERFRGRIPIPGGNPTQIQGWQAGGTDYRTVIPWIAEQQELGLTNQYFEPPLDIAAYQKDVMGNSYMIWIRNQCFSSAPSPCAGAVLTEINARPTVYQTSCPSSFVGCQ